MNRGLRRLCELYIQDHDLIYEKATDPIDMFCRQNGPQAQEELLREMVEFYEDTKSGKKTLQDLINMGLGWVPGDWNTFDWFRSAIEYLRAKLQDARQADIGSN